MRNLFKYGLLVSIISLGGCVEDPDILLTITRSNDQTNFTVDACATTNSTCAGTGVDPVFPFTGRNLTGTVGLFLDPVPDFPAMMVLEIQRTTDPTDCRAFDLNFSEVPFEIEAQGDIVDQTVLNVCPSGICGPGRACGSTLEEE